MTTPDIKRQVLAAAAAAEDKKAEDIRILALDPSESSLTDYFLICNGTNDRQNVAISDSIDDRMKRDFGMYPNSVEGRRQGEWILMDYVDFVVHIFSPEKRAHYGLERLRKSAIQISLSELNAELNARVMRAYGMSRAELFATVDAPALKALPAAPYAFALWKRCRVAPDYHVEIDGCWYSVPHRLIRELVDVRIADRTVEAFHKGERVASHAKSPKKSAPNPSAKKVATKSAPKKAPAKPAKKSPAKK